MHNHKWRKWQKWQNNTLTTPMLPCVALVFALSSLALTGCQHIQLVKHPLPFNSPTFDNAQNTQNPQNPQTNPPNPNKADELPDTFFILENWF